MVVTPDPGREVYAVEEVLPPGVTIAAVGDGGVFDGASNAIRWGPYFDGAPRIFSYTETRLSMDIPVAAITGRLSIDGTSSPIVHSGVASRADTDGDGDVDLADYLLFPACFSGAGALVGVECKRVDFDNDGDVDLADLVALQSSFTGDE